MNAKMFRTVAGVFLAFLLQGTSTASLGATVNQEFKFTQDSRIVVENLVGRVKVRPADGSQAYVKASVIGESEELVRQVKFEFKDHGSRQSLEILYPEDHRTLYFEDDNGRTSSNVTYRGKKYRVSNYRKNGAEALQVDLELFLPKGARVDNLKNLVGGVDLADVDADIRIDVGAGRIGSVDGSGKLVADTGSGGVEVTNHTGAISVDTGSGNVKVLTVLGDVSADTGSGTVDVSGVSGNVEADTGSGNVILDQIIGNSISADTGSGSVKARDIRGSFKADTGSGSVRVEGIADSDLIDVDTGSGSVKISGDLSGLKRLKVDTGSGDVEVDSHKTLNMALRIKVDSGDIDVDMPDMTSMKSSRNRLEVSLGDGSGEGRIDTGSGDVTVR
jgi:DUF4097 and DUF4098 domain-containing protein YvlB